MHPERLHAFVLGTHDYGDTDRIVSLFTLEHGRIKAFARGARKSRKRFGAALELFARIDVQVKLKDGLCGLSQADIHSIYPGIRANLHGIAHALYACELVEAITPEGQPLPRLYRLLAAYFDRLEAATPSLDDRRFFEINLLNILGYRPSLEACSRCAAPFGAEGALMSDGELICRFCAGSGQPVQAATLSRLRACLATGTFGLVTFSGDMAAQAGALLDQAIAGYAGRRLKSVDFLHQLV
jgi:DNA repair protein RecO (recombination protein O)